MFSLEYLFLECGRTLCPDASDINDDGRLNLGDPILLLTHLFLDGNDPAPPFEECDDDPTPDTTVGCMGYTACD